MCLVLTSLAVPIAAHAQAPRTQPAQGQLSQGHPAQAQPASAEQVRPVANLVIGDGVMVVKAAPAKVVYVGAGSANRTVAFTFDAAAVDEFVAAAQAVVRRGSGALPPHTPDRPVLQELSSGRALSMSRHIEGHGRSANVSYHFFVADERLSGFTLPANAVETKSILQALHRAARAANAIAAATDSARAAARKTRRRRG